VDTPLYVLGCERDHIAPWRTAYQAPQVVGGDEHRFVLGSSGHVAGMVAPVGSPKYYRWERGSTPADADDWLRGASRVEGSWWEDWAAWAAARAGERVAPPTLPDGDPAPGRYVRG
jgi:polyhydroxyalkanoate synthase